MFKVGDKVKIIKCIRSHNNGYSIGDIHTITKINKEDIWLDNTYYCSKFEIELAKAQFTKSDLKDGDIVTYRDNHKAVVLEKQTRLRSINETGLMYLDDYDKELNYKTGGHKGTINDIVKVERPVQYETVFERKEEILDEAEKRYLRDVIRPFRNTVRFIEKEDNGKIARIKICFDYHFMFFPTLEKEKKMYEGMQPNRTYTLKELGL